MAEGRKVTEVQRDGNVIRIPAAKTVAQVERVEQVEKVVPVEAVALAEEGEVRKIVLREGQSPGDILTFTNAIGDLKRTYPHWLIDVRSPAESIWDNNPHLTPLDENASDVEMYDITYDDINISGWNGLHFSDAFRNDIEKKLNMDELFFIDSENQEHLSKKIVPEVIRQRCAGKGIDLSAQTIVAHTSYPSRWLILDPSTDNRLEIRHERNELYVYNANPERVKRWGVACITKTGIKPELFISEEERSWWHQIHCEFFWDGPYWVINAGRKPDNELKQYHRWQEVAELFNERFQGKIKLVQMGHPDHIHPPLAGAFNLIGKTDLRQLMRLAFWAHGTVGPLSFQFVISAAFEQPAVCVAAGKEGVKWHLYPHIRHVCTNGAVDCCRWDGCWLGGESGQCKKIIDHVPLCFRLIEPRTIVDAIAMYYEGGRLELPTDEQMAEWTRDIFVLDADPERQEAFTRKFSHHRVTIVSTAKDACDILSKEKYDVVCLTDRLSPDDADIKVVQSNSGVTVAQFLAQQALETHIIAHCNEGEGLNSIRKYLPNVDHRPVYWV